MARADVVVVGYDGAELVDIACVTSALRLAGDLGARPRYEVRLTTVDGGPVRADGGLSLGPARALAQVRSADTVIVSGGNGHEAASRDHELVRQVRRLGERARRVASVCTGATVLARTGLLDGRRVTTHWFHAKELAEQFPGVHVDAGPIYLREGRFATSGGVTASLDLTLAFIEEDHGPELARWVAMGMVTYLQRPGNQAQMSIFTESRRPSDATVRAAVDHAVAHPDGDLSTDALSRHVGVSARQLNRLFHDQLGETPGAAVRRIRLELAGRLVSSTDLPLSQVAHRCGFRSAETLRQAFVARYGASPREFRTRSAAS